MCLWGVFLVLLCSSYDSGCLVMLYEASPQRIRRMHCSYGHSLRARLALVSEKAHCCPLTHTSHFHIWPLSPCECLTHFTTGFQFHVPFFTIFQWSRISALVFNITEWQSVSRRHLQLIAFICIFSLFLYLQGQYALIHITVNVPVLAKLLIFNCCPWVWC